MLARRQPDLQQQPLQVLNDEKFFMRLLSKDTSASNPSFRIYYGVAAAGAVPFLWESQPGRPKHSTAASTLPPLTPPPSYYITPEKPSRSAGNKLSIRCIISRLVPPKKPHRPSPSLPPSSSSSSSSASSRSHRRGRYSSPRSSFSSNSKLSDEGSEEALSPTSSLCFWGRRRTGGRGGCWPFPGMDLLN